MEPSSGGNARSIGILRSRNVSARLSSCSRPLPAEAATGRLRRCSSGVFQKGTRAL
jgi:hypothetical protein